MAITIHQQPNLYTPAYNPMRFVIASTNYNQPNFNYIVDVYTSGTVGYTRFLFPPDPTTGNAAPDISGCIEQLITHDISDSLYGFQRCTNSITTYEVKFGEQYGASGSIQNYVDLSVTGTKYAWNGVLSPFLFAQYNYTNYTIGNSGVFLTNQPENQYYSNYSSDSRSLYFINDTSGSAHLCVVKTYDVNNNLLGTYKINNPYQASSSYLDKLLRVGVGGEDLNNATLFSGVQPVITSSVSYYEVYLNNWAETNQSTSYFYRNECQWKGQEAITLHFKNRLGGFDTFDFRLVRKKLSETSRDTFQKNLGSLSGNTWSYSITDRGSTVYNSEINDRIIAESDWISDAQSTWLQELIESPEVYYHFNQTSLIPVVVKTSGYETKTIKQEKLFHLTVEVYYSNKRWTQRG